jgi:hypothetical protein
MTYLGSEHGAVLGPYSDDEIGPRLHGRRWLEAQGSKTVWSIRASSLADARARLASERKKGS